MRDVVDPALARACAIVAYKDAQPLRRALFARKAALSPAVRAVLATWARLRGTRAASAFVGAYGAKSFAEVRLPARDGALWSIAEYANEARQIDGLAALVPEIRIARVTLGLAGRGALRALRALDLAPARALLDRYVREGDFLIAARVASTIGYYARILPALRRSRARAVVVSSDTNPSALALVYAAKHLGLRTCFVAHGHVAEGPPPLAFDLAILDGPAVRDVYARAGAIEGEVVYRGVEGRSLPLRTAALRRGVGTLGVFLSILFDPVALARRIAELRAALAPRGMLIRLHPNRQMRDPDWARGLDLDGVVVSDGARSIERDCAECDLVACGSSSAHLSALKLGVPTIYVPGLDDVADDYYAFVARGVVPRFEAGSLADVGALASFFDDPAWGGRFRAFDAAYPSRQPECDADVRRALEALAS